MFFNLGSHLVLQKEFVGHADTCNFMDKLLFDSKGEYFHSHQERNRAQG